MRKLNDECAELIDINSKLAFSGMIDMRTSIDHIGGAAKTKDSFVRIA